MSERNSHEYDPLAPTDLDDSLPTVYTLYKRARLSDRFASAAGWTITTSLLISILWLMLHSHQAHVHGTPHPAHSTSPDAQLWKNCGPTTAAAREQGCRFAISSFSWERPECYDDKMVEEFMAEKDWQFFESENGTIPIPKETALAGEYDVLWVTEDYHHVHCMYAWRQMHRAFTTRRYISRWLNDYNHVLHCYNVMVGKQFPLDVVGDMVEVKFPDCLPIL